MSIELIGHARVAADAAARGVVVEIFQRPAAHSLSEAAELLGITPWDIVKNLGSEAQRRDVPLRLGARR